MRLIPPEFIIKENEGFTPERDIFERKDFGDRLTIIIQRLEGPSVILLDAPWGMGKTTFVKMWRGALLKANVQSIYFDAFASDYQEDAFLALAGEVIARAEKERPATKKSAREFQKDCSRSCKSSWSCGIACWCQRGNGRLARCWSDCGGY